MVGVTCVVTIAPVLPIAFLKFLLHLTVGTTPDVTLGPLSRHSLEKCHQTQGLWMRDPTTLSVCCWCLMSPHSPARLLLEPLSKNP